MESRTPKKLILIISLLLCFAGSYALGPGFFKDPAPSPDGSQICFVYENDLWLVPFNGGNAVRLTNTDASEWSPIWSPDGSQIAFNSNRESSTGIYTISPRGGSAELIYPDRFSVVDWFADGEHLLVARSSFELGTGFYKLPLTGERPTLLAEIGDSFASLSPDNTKIIFNRYGDPFREAYRGSLNGDLWELDLASGNYTRLTSTPTTERYVSHSYLNNEVYFCASDGSKFQLMKTRNGNFARAEMLSNFDYWSARDIKISRSTDRLTYEFFNEVWAYDPARAGRELGSGCFKVEINILEDQWQNSRRTSAMTNEFNEFAVSSDHLLVGFNYMYDLFAVPRKGGDAKQLSFDMNGASQLIFLKDNRTILMRRTQKGEDKLFTVKVDSVATEIKPVNWFGADSLIVESLYRDHSGLIVVIYRDRLRGGNIAWTDDDLTEFHTIPTPYAASSNITFSPDKSFAAFAVVRDDIWIRELYLYDLQNQELIKLMNDDQWIGSISWTPDSRSLLLGRGGDIYRLDLVPRDELEYDKNHWNEILRYVEETSPPEGGPEIDPSAETAVADSLAPAVEPLSEPIEPELAETTETPESPETLPESPEPVSHVTLVRENLRERLYPVVSHPNNGLYVLHVASDSVFYYISYPSDRSQGTEIFKINIYGKNNVQETNLGSGFGDALKVDTTIYYTQNHQLKSYNLESSTRREITASVNYEYDVNLLNRRVFEQVWGAFGLNFYDLNMHGQDWNAAFERYAPYLENVRNTNDLESIVDEMIGDVNASHTGFYPRQDVVYPSRSQAYLGLEFDYAERLPEGVRVRYVYPGTRLSYFYHLLPGEIITQIDGHRITSRSPLDSLLIDKIGKPIRLSVHRDSTTVEMIVPGLTWSQVRNLWYEDRVNLSTQQVNELSGGRLGYVHIPSMGEENWTEFIRDLFRDNADKEALIIDVRGNTGGRIHDQIISLLIKTPYGYSTSRRYSREKRYEPSRIWAKPSIVLVDEHSFSDGEIFPIIYQELKLGKVVGFPSSGAVIGTWEYDLIDGSSMRMPSTGWYKLDGTNMEGTGAQPDIVIEHTPNDLVKRNDLQLQRAITELLRELETGE